MKNFVLLISVLISACAAKIDAPKSSGYIAPECDDMSAKSNVQMSVSDQAFGPRLKQSLCVKGYQYGLPLESKIRIVSYKNGTSDIEFLCDKKQASVFFNKNSGKKVFFVFNEKIVGSASAATGLGDGRCVLPHLEDLGEAVSLCEKLSSGLGFSENQCYETCDASDRQKKACVWTSRGRTAQE